VQQVVIKLAEAMDRLATDPDLRRRMSDACIAAAYERTWRNIVTRAYELVAMELALRIGAQE
jgi:glycosyltransferase involved in cell wall biosynthesis